MLSRLWLGVLFAVAFVLAPRTAEATQIRFYDRAELEAAAAGSTHVVVGRFVGWKHEPAIASAPFSVTKMYGDTYLARVRVERVLAGSTDIQGREVTVIERNAGQAVDDSVLFLRRERDRFWLVDNALFPMSGEDVGVALAPNRTRMPLAELEAIVEPIHQVRISWTGRIAERARAGGTLAVHFIAKNEGDENAYVLPPSYCASVKSYPLGDDGLWHADENAWHTAPSEWFRTRKDVPVLVSAGESHEFRYEIPLSSMNMDWPGRFDVVLGMTEGFCNVERARPLRVAPSYMADRVLRVTVDPRDAPAPPSQMTSAPPAYTAAQQGGCAATTTSRSGAVTRAAVFGVALVVLVVLWRRRARRTERPDTI